MVNIDLDFLIREYEKKYNLPKNLLRAVIEHESHYIPTAKFHEKDGTYSYGLCQIHDVNFKLLSKHFKKKIDKNNIYDYNINLESGAYLLADAYKRSGKNLLKTFGAYASGTVGKGLKVGAEFLGIYYRMLALDLLPVVSGLYLLLKSISGEK